METSKHSCKRKPHPGRVRMRGVTLIETVAALAVAAIVAAIGVPSLKGTLSSSHATIVSDRLLTDLASARSEAVMSRTIGMVCPSIDGSSCSGGTDWSKGWIVFVDSNDDHQRSASEPVLSVVSASDLGGLQVATTTGRSEVRFLPDGRNGGTNLSMRVCDGSRLTRLVVINVSGRARIEQPDAPDTTCE